MSDQIVGEEQRVIAENSTPVAVNAEKGSAGCAIQGKSRLKGALGMAICCAAPLLLFAAIAFFGLSLGAIASGALSLVALLACPIGMYLMMRMMMREKSRIDVL
jgi:hypothetical protein